MSTSTLNLIVDLLDVIITSRWRKKMQPKRRLRSARRVSATRFEWEWN